MKPRIEKKLSKALAAIFEGTNEYSGVWIDNEWCRDTPYWRGEALTGKQERQKRECRVSVNHVPSVGGEADYWGEGTDYYTLHQAYTQALWTNCVYTDDLCRQDCLTPRPEEGTPEHEVWEATKAALLAQARRNYQRLKPGYRVLAHARLEAAPLRVKEAIRLERAAKAKAEWEARRAATQAAA